MNTQTTDFTQESLIQLEDGKAFTSSLTIAHVFAKPHKHVLDSIRRITEELNADFTEPNFRPSEYADDTGRTLPAYLLSRDAFTLVAMSFNGKKALLWKVCYINAFNAMEQELLQSKLVPTQEVEIAQNPPVTSAKAAPKTVTLQTFTPASPATIQGLRGLIALWAVMEETPKAELERTLLNNYGFPSFDDVQDWDTDEMEWTLVKRLFRAVGDITEGSTAPEDRLVLDGLLDFGVALRGFSHSHLEGVICMLCNVPDINHLSPRGVRKATFALWSFLNRYPVSRDCLSEAMYAVKEVR